MDSLARDLYGAEFVAEAVYDDVLAVFDNAEYDRSSLTVSE